MFLAEFSVIHLVVISFKIELINFYEFSCLLLVFYLVLDTFVFFLVTVLTVASSSVFVSLVICKAEPAKLMLTLSTRHMITTLIFFYQFPAFRIWTLLSKSFQPSQVFWLVFFLVSPRLNLCARPRSMILLETFKTKSVATIAIYDSLVRGIRPINNFVATFPRTPLEESALVRKLLRMPLDIFCPVVYPIFFALFIIEVGNEKAMGYGYVAIVLLTFEKNTLWVILNLYFYIILPADFVVLVTAN